MKPKIDGSEFGFITIDGDCIEHDILIRLSGEVTKRNKKLSKAVYGTSHTISLAEAEYIFEKGVEQLIVGAGQNGMVRLSDEAADYFARKGIAVDLSPTPEAIARWNKAHGSVVGLFHVTC
ncbi:MAG: MTH938/NDUFAF3 family protein [Sulfuritalea sp.]